jgi:hypothetical protein
MDNPENPALQDTQDTIQRQTQHKHNTTCTGHHHAQTNTNDVK